MQVGGPAACHNPDKRHAQDQIRDPAEPVTPAQCRGPENDGRKAERRLMPETIEYYQRLDEPRAWIEKTIAVKARMPAAVADRNAVADATDMSWARPGRKACSMRGIADAAAMLAAV